MSVHTYSEVDVFSPTAYRGNPLAVVHDAEGLTSEDMQRFAKWTNLSETTFLLPPTDPAADYRVRIFTTTVELPFAGHPTLGSASAWLGAGGVPKNGSTIVQECGAGLVSVRADGRRLAFEAPPLTKYGPLDTGDLRRVAEALGIAETSIIDASWLVNGPNWIGVRLATAQEVLDLQPNPADLGMLEIGVIGPHDEGHDAQFEVRAFVGGDFVWEDPVTGSLNAGLAQWMTDTGVVDQGYVAAQGTAIGYEGRVHLTVGKDGIWVGGDVTSCVRGEVTL